MKQANDQARPSGCSEAMSRLIDGELDGSGCRELVDRLSADAASREAWVLMNIACDAVQSSETAAMHATGFVTRVSAALAAEPVVLAPRALLRGPSVLRRIVLPAAAMAAAAAVLAVVAVPQLRAPQTEPKLAGEAVRVPASPVPDGVIRSAVLEAYLDAHRESAAGPVSSRANDYVPATLKTESR